MRCSDRISGIATYVIVIVVTCFASKLLYINGTIIVVPGKRQPMAMTDQDHPKERERGEAEFGLPEDNHESLSDSPLSVHEQLQLSAKRGT